MGFYKHFAFYKMAFPKKTKIQSLKVVLPFKEILITRIDRFWGNVILTMQIKEPMLMDLRYSKQVYQGQDHREVLGELFLGTCPSSHLMQLIQM